MNKENLEKWKIERWIGLLSCIFDTCFLAFLWIMGWTGVFWAYIVVFAFSLIGHGIRLTALEAK